LGKFINTIRHSIYNFTEIAVTRRPRFKIATFLGLALLVLMTACSSGDTNATPTEDDASASRAGPTVTMTPSPTKKPTQAPTATTPAATVEEEASPAATAAEEAAAPTSTPEIGPDGLYTEVQLSEGGTQYLVPWDRIFSGGVPRDGIPSIDDPQFADSSTWNDLEYRENGLVIGVDVDGVRRAYPFQVIVWHEIVNDTINGKPILISYCPLCGSAIAFERTVDGVEAEFGVSGLLYNSDLLMYDRTDESLWSQINGTAVVGDQVGKRLEYYPSEIMTWGDWRKTYPDSAVLTTDTGAARDYSRDPYENYYFDESLLFPVNRTSEIYDIVHTKSEVTGIEVAGPEYGAFLDRDVREVGIVNEQVGDTPVLVFADPSAGENIVVFNRALEGEALTFAMDESGLVDEETGTTWSFDGLGIDGPLAGAQLDEIIPVKGFWFGWVAFHPMTSLWHLPDQ
jgi:hypothetical protein